MSNGFKLIAIRPLEGCAPNIRKILKVNTTYFLYKNYEVDSENEDMIKPKEGVGLQDNFYRLSNQDSPIINISAIVGKNGDGKSSIIEMIMRVINNFAYASGFRKRQEELQAVKGLYAIFHYSIEDKIYFIKSEGNELRTSFIPNKIFRIDDPCTDINADEDFHSKFFYTQVTNYALYSYNSLEMQYESISDEKCWIDGIFHKNDAYQTPIVLNPWRYEGNIDVNLENSLTKQRLISLFVDDGDNENGIRNINKKQFAKYLIYHPYNTTKLSQKTYEEHFYHVIQYDNRLLDSHLLDLKEDAKFVNNFNNLQGSHLYALNELRMIIESNISDFHFALKIAQKTNQNEINTKPTPDFKNYLQELTFLINKYSASNQNIEDPLSIIDFFVNEGFNQFNIQQIQRVILVVSIRQLWNSINDGQYSVENVYGNDELCKAKQYVIYKTISIFEKYPQYRGLESISAYNGVNLIFNYSSKLDDHINNQLKCFEKLQEEIKGNSHETLKLRQTLNFIDNYTTYIDKSLKNEALLTLLNETNTNLPLDSYVISFDELRIRLDATSSKSRIELLPPPIFRSEIILQQNTSDEEFSMLSGLSSGERQILHNISSVIYHLKNLNSVSSSELVQYRNINLFFEEIELYFHPDFQRNFINSFIKNVEKAKLDKIKNINICFTTHSPFILSDIPISNILKLKKGEPEIEERETFGANIHDMLRHGFFMKNGTMGEFAKQKINEILDFLEQANKQIENYEKKKKELNLIIDLIGEPVIKNHLRQYWHEVFGEPSYEELLEKLKEYETNKNR